MKVSGTKQTEITRENLRHDATEGLEAPLASAATRRLYPAFIIFLFCPVL